MDTGALILSHVYVEGTFGILVEFLSLGCIVSGKFWASCSSPGRSKRARLDGEYSDGRMKWGKENKAGLSGTLGKENPGIASSCTFMTVFYLISPSL